MIHQAGLPPVNASQTITSAAEIANRRSDEFMGFIRRTVVAPNVPREAAKEACSVSEVGSTWLLGMPSD
jgi:hypothetical protein